MNIQPSFHPLSEDDIAELAAVWNRCFAKPYRVSVQMILEKLVQDNDTFYPATFICKVQGRVVAFIACKVTDNSIADYDHTAWLSTVFTDEAYRHMDIGSLLYQKAENELKKAGIKKILAAGDMNNFYSGIPDPSPELKAFFTRQGFIFNDTEHYDLTADVSCISFEELSAAVNQSEDYITRPYTAEDSEKLSAFLSAEFPGRWQVEMQRFIIGGGNFKHLLLLCNGLEIKGFCKIHVSSGDDGLGLHLGSHWGGLGPIGIAGDIRGKGLGNRLLYDSLKHLQAGHARNVNIDWTVLKDFYGQFGFKPWRTYLGAYKTI